MSYNQLQKGNSNAAKSRRQYTEPKCSRVQKQRTFGEFLIQNSTCHIQVEHTCIDPACASAEGVWQWLNQV